MKEKDPTYSSAPGYSEINFCFPIIESSTSIFFFGPRFVLFQGDNLKS